MHVSITIEKNIPVPGHATCSMKYPFRAMGVGDSFEVSTELDNAVRSAASLYSKKNPGVKFTTRRLDGKMRVWRIA